jgi:hypothetical protein
MASKRTRGVRQKHENKLAETKLIKNLEKNTIKKELVRNLKKTT